MPTRGESLVKGELGHLRAGSLDDRPLDDQRRRPLRRLPRWISGAVSRAAPLQPTRDYTFAAVTSQSMHDITPRLGASYDLFGNGKTAIKASLGKYMLTLFTIGNPAGRQHDDDAELERPDVSGRRSAAGQLQSRLRPVQPSGQRSNARRTSAQFGHADLDRAVQRGHALRVGQPAVQLGVLDERAARNHAAPWHRRRLLPALVWQLPGDAGRRADGGRLRPVQRDGAASTLGCPTAAATGSTGSTTSTRRRWVRARTTRRSRGDFGKQTEHWNGMDFSANARLQNGLVLQGGVSTGRATTDNCEVISNSQGAVFAALPRVPVRARARVMFRRRS